MEREDPDVVVVEAQPVVDPAVFSPPQQQQLNLSSSRAPSPKRALFADLNTSVGAVAAGGGTPLSCMRTPGSSKKPRVSFGSVETRKFRIGHGGALSTPAEGAYPIGLSWDVAGEERASVSERELAKAPTGVTNASPRRLDERARKRLLEKVDRRSYFEKQASYENERMELAMLRQQRQHVGCNCNGASTCGTRSCLCYQHDVACNDDSCKCSCETCINPKRYNFDQSEINGYRQRRIREAVFLTDPENSEPILL